MTAAHRPWKYRSRRGPPPGWSPGGRPRCASGCTRAPAPRRAPRSRTVLRPSRAARHISCSSGTTASRRW
eukprot:11223829-Lingulodinium_polyedra.AAC.1